MENTKNFFALGYVRVIMVLILLAVLGALVSYTHYTLKQARYNNWGPTTINVRGEGEVLAKPDIGQFSFSVRAEGEDANTAQEKSAESINAIIDYLTGESVHESDIKTQNYYLNPTYTYTERVCAVGSYCPPGEQEIDGYEVTQSVVVKVRDLEAAGDLISGVGQRGATNISSLQFTIDDETTLQAEARAEAIADAKQKAKELARDLDVRLVRMVSYYEEQGYYPEPYYGGYGGDMAMSESAVRKSPSLPTGEDEIKSVVNITYEIK